MSIICHRWGFTNVKWKDANWKWSECQLVAEVLQFVQGVDAHLLTPPWEKDKEKKKRLICLICKVKGEKYDECKEVHDDIKIKAEDIKLVVKAMLDIDVDIKL